MKLFGQEFLKYKKEPKFTDPKTWNWKPAHPEWLVTDTPFPIGEPSIVHKVKKKFSLIIGQESAECGALVKELKEQDTPFVFINWDEQEDGVFSIHLKGGKKTASITLDEKTLKLENATSVYIEPPVMMTTLERKPGEFDESETLFVRRWISLLKDLPEFTPNATWYPGEPENLLLNAQKKMTELSIAQDCGFDIPETMITNSPAEAKAFYDKQKGQVLFRDFGTQKVFDSKGVKTYDVSLLSEPNGSWELAAETPVVLQKYIDKVYDLRVIAIGSKLLAVKIDSQNSEKSKVDWREYDLANVAYEVTNLDKEISKPIKKFMKQLSLTMGSFDFSVDKKGRAFFLEMNRPGAWLFIETLSGAPVRKTLAKTLSRKK